MIVYGYAKQYKYANDGTLLVQVRIPSIHGPYDLSQAKGKTVRNYVRDADLPWYESVLLPHLPNEGEVVMMASVNEAKSAHHVVLGLTGGSYYNQVQGDLNG